jgi:hypothetical protein
MVSNRSKVSHGIKQFECIINYFLYHVIPSSWLIPCDTFKLCYAMWYLQIVYTMRYLQQTFFIPCDTFNLCYTMWCIQTVLCHVIPLICFTSCEWTIWRYHMVWNSLNVPHGIKHFEGITWKKTVWKYHMVERKRLLSVAFKLCYAMWYLYSVLYHVIPSTTFFCIPCDTFNLCYTMWCIQTVLWWFKQFEGITWYKQFEDITWYQTDQRYHMA